MALCRCLLAAMVCFAASAQEQAPTEAPIIRETVNVVVAPVTVLDRDGNYVNGLQPQQFRLFDNDKEQDIKVDQAFHPISLVLVIQANSAMEAILPKIQKIGVMIEPLVIGEQGEAAVLAFDHRLQVVQDFTSDASKITEAIKKLRPGSSSSRLNDAVFQAVRMLQHRPENHRRVILLISETRDKASEGRVRESLLALQLANVTLHSVDVSRLVTTLTGKPQPPRLDPLPPAMHPLPPGVPATPENVMRTTGSQGSSANFIPLMVELFKDVKAIFRDNPVEAYTKGTGGAEFSFYRQKGLEEAISKIGEELHSQYLIAYNPNNKEEGGFHEIKVFVSGRPDVKARTRPGYWLATVK